jgi:hypothetical protein
MAETTQASGSQCTCACHHGAVTGCALKTEVRAQSCCAVAEIGHDSPVICPYCNGLADRLSAHVLECTGNRHLTLDGRRVLSRALAAAHTARS